MTALQNLANYNQANLNSLKTRLMEIRKQKGLSASQVGANVDMTAGWVRTFEEGFNEPSLTDIALYAHGVCASITISVEAI